jgi:hypothetical protein
MIVSNERDQRQQWLNSLKVGDEVAVRHKSWSGRAPYTISVITKITPTRMFDVEGFTRIKNDGGGMIPVTDEIRNEVARSKAAYFIKHLDWNKLTTQQLLDVLKIIKPDETK